MSLHTFQKLVGRDRMRAALPRPSRRPGRSRFLPRIDALEGRALLSTLVVQNLGDSGSGSLRAELGLAHNGDTITFASGLKGTITLSSKLLEVAKSVDIKGPGANVLTVSGNNALQVFQVDAGVTASISGLTIANGLAPASTFGNGGGILNEGTLTVDRSTFTNDSAPGGYGGGIENDGPLTLSNSTFKHDLALYGGAINSTGTLTVTSSRFQTDSATSGGGGAIAYAPFVSPATPATITNCTLRGNTAGEGGAIYDQSSMTISNSVISNNAGPVPYQDSGGGIFTGFGGSLTITNSTVTGNSAQFGGGIGVAGGTVSINTCLIADNTASYAEPYSLALGGGVWASGGFSPGTEVTVTNSTFSSNQVIADTADGGAIHADFDAVVNVVNSSFNDNTVSGNLSSQGGAINIDGGAQASISGSSFVNNQAVVPSSTPYLGVAANGGAINSQGGPLKVKQSLFSKNQAVGGPGGGNGSGGGVYADDGSTTTITDTLITLNFALGGNGGGQGAGGGLYIDGATLIVSGKTKVVGNLASTSDNNIFQ